MAILLPFASLWGGCGLFTWMKEPRFVAGGTAADHVVRGWGLLDSYECGLLSDYEGPSDASVRVATQEFEAALRLRPGDDEATLGKARCLETRGDREGADLYRPALDLTRGVILRTRDPERRRDALRQVAGLHTKLSEHSLALAAYRRLLATTPDAGERLQIRYQIAQAEEALGRYRNALRDFEALERWTGKAGSYAWDIQRVCERLGQQP